MTTQIQGSEQIILNANLVLDEDRPTRIGKIAQLPEQAILEFKSRLRGKLIFPGQAGYEEARKVYNAMINKRPGVIARCVGVSDVLACVNFARENDLLVAIRGAGHNVAGTSVCDEGIVIDLSEMKGIHIDPVNRTVRVEPGVTWAEVTHELQVFGLGVTGGFVSTTGVSGLTLGGGLGWLVRKHGLALDNLLSADVVMANGELLTADINQNSDLFWCIRGGGGNFGIVTSFKFRAHPVGTVLAGNVLHPITNGVEVLQFWRDYVTKSPDELTGAALIFNAPSELPLPEVLKQNPIVAVGGLYAGSLQTAEQVLRPLREFGPPAADIFQEMPFNAAQSMADFLWPRGLYNYWKSSFLNEITDDAIDTILEFAAKAPSRLSVFVIEHIGNSAMSRFGDDETAFGNRKCPFNLLITAVWTREEDSAINIEWTRQFWDAMKPFMAEAVYVNYLGDEGEERIRSAYGKDKYDRLVALKKKFDPTNMFCLNQNIKPIG